MTDELDRADSAPGEPDAELGAPRAIEDDETLEAPSRPEGDPVYVGGDVTDDDPGASDEEEYDEEYGDEVVVVRRRDPVDTMLASGWDAGASGGLDAKLHVTPSLTLDLAGHAATLDARPLDLTPTEFELLTVFLQNPGRAFSRLELLDRVQGDAYEAYERTIDAHIKNLRAKLGDDPRQPRFIQTVFGVGYKLGADL